MPYYVRTIRSHQQTVPRVNAVAEAIRNLASQIHGRYPIAHPANRGIVNLQNVLSKLRSVLDDDFHSLITDDDEARRLGNIYYVRSRHSMMSPPPLERQEAVGIDDDDDSDVTEAESEDDEDRDAVISSLIIKRPGCSP